MADLKCPKCNGNLVQGFIPDYDYGESQRLVSSWVEGRPKKSWWAGTRVPVEGGIAVAAFRCRGCGYVEFYADEKFAAE